MPRCEADNDKRIVTERGASARTEAIQRDAEVRQHLFPINPGHSTTRRRNEVNVLIPDRISLHEGFAQASRGFGLENQRLRFPE
jgi:hypothetical protein